MARPNRSPVGIWLVGARGSVAATTIAGLVALQKKKLSTTGLVSELPHFAHLDMPRWPDFVVGGHDIRKTPLLETLESLGTEISEMRELLPTIRRDVAKVEKLIRPGTLINVGERINSISQGRKRADESPSDAIARIQTDLKNFVRKQRLGQLIVVNVASTEPPVDTKKLPRKWADLEKILDNPKKCPLGASSLYAIAALDLGYPYINFTPSTGATPKAIQDLAVQRETCTMGRDGKTGETLLKSVLGPMFAKRNLEVMSWVGHNIFGNLDGKVLDDPENKQTKVTSKDQLLSEILGYRPQTHVSIEFIESLGEWKTAWDHIHFRGFMGTPMKLQFTWQGCDSILAAPLVLDLARFTAVASREGQTGRLPFLACFFKSPNGVKHHDFDRQFELLMDWARSIEPSINR